MSDINFSPYAVKLRFYLGGAHYYTVTRPDGAVVTIETDDDLASCLNAAYAKGVEDERARIAPLADCEPEEMTTDELRDTFIAIRKASEPSKVNPS